MKNKNILKYGILILGVVIVIIGLVMFFTKPNNNDNSIDKDNDSNNKVEKPNSKNQVYECENKLDNEGVSYTSYQIETVYVEDGIVKKTVPTMKIVCDNKDMYAVFKNDKEYSKDKKFDDKKLTITFANGEEVSLEKDINGNETEVKYSDYEKVLKNVGYNCKNK